jgi:hypothetical protein
MVGDGFLSEPVIQPKGCGKAIYRFDIFRFRAASMEEIPLTEGLQPFVAIGPGTRRGWITGRRGEEVSLFIAQYVRWAGISPDLALSAGCLRCIPGKRDACAPGVAESGVSWLLLALTAPSLTVGFPPVTAPFLAVGFPPVTAPFLAVVPPSSPSSGIRTLSQAVTSPLHLLCSVS